MFTLRLVSRLACAGLLVLVVAAPLSAGSDFIRFDPGTNLTITLNTIPTVSVTIPTNNGDWLRQGPDGTVVLHAATSEATLLVITAAGEVLQGEGNFSMSATFLCDVFDPDTGAFAGCSSTGEKLNLSLHGEAVDGGGEPFTVLARWLQKDGEFRKLVTEAVPAD